MKSYILYIALFILMTIIFVSIFINLKSKYEERVYDELNYYNDLYITVMTQNSDMVNVLPTNASYSLFDEDELVAEYNTYGNIEEQIYNSVSLINNKSANGHIESQNRYFYSINEIDTSNGSYYSLITYLDTGLLEMKSILFMYFLIVVFILILAYLLHKKIDEYNYKEPLEYISNRINNFSTTNSMDIILPNEEMEEIILAVNRFKDYSITSIRTLSLSNRNQHMILNAMNSGFIAVDLDGKIIVFNNASIDILESKKIYADNYIYNSIRNNEFIKMYNKYDGVNELSEEIQYAIDNISKKLKIKINPLFDSSEEKVGNMIIIEDVTDLRKLETMRTDFASNVTHELKTPLTSILGFVDTLEDGAIEDEAIARKFLNIIKLEANRLKRLIEDILYLSEIETYEIKKENTENICEIMNYTIEVLEKKAENKHIKIIKEMPDKILFDCDRDSMTQVFMNIVDNSIKYTDVGSIKITLKEKYNSIKFIVEDTGKGINEENIERIFERFYREDKSRKGESTGLGLSIVKHIVNVYNGSIKVESELDKGSKFIITFPKNK